MQGRRVSVRNIRIICFRVNLYFLFIYFKPGNLWRLPRHSGQGVWQLRI